MRGVLAIVGVTAAALAATAFTLRQQLAQLLSTIGPKWSNLHPDVQRRALAVLEQANAEFAPLGLAVGIFDGWRAEADQQKEIDQGDSFVAGVRRSYHVWGLAVDFVFIDKRGRWTWDPDGDGRANVGPLWRRLGDIIKANGFEWGGDWSRPDGPHAQLPLVRSAALISQYPEGFQQWQSSWA